MTTQRDIAGNRDSEAMLLTRKTSWRRQSFNPDTHSATEQDGDDESYEPPPEHSSPRYLGEKKVRRAKGLLSFHNAVRVVLIPTRQETFDAGLGSGLWWSDGDYATFKSDAISELRTCMLLLSCTSKEAIHNLYQTCTISDCPLCAAVQPLQNSGEAENHHLAPGARTDSLALLVGARNSSRDDSLSTDSSMNGSSHGSSSSSRNSGSGITDVGNDSEHGSAGAMTASLKKTAASSSSTSLYPSSFSFPSSSASSSSASSTQAPASGTGASQESSQSQSPLTIRKQERLRWEEQRRESNNRSAGLFLSVDWGKIARDTANSVFGPNLAASSSCSSSASLGADQETAMEESDSRCVSNSSSMSGFDQYSLGQSDAFNTGSDQTSPEGSACGEETLIFPGRSAPPPTQVGGTTRGAGEKSAWRRGLGLGKRVDLDDSRAMSPSPLSLPSYAHLRDVGADGQQQARADSPASSSPSDQEGGASNQFSSSSSSDGGSSWRWVRRDGPSPSRGCFGSASSTPDSVSSDSDSSPTDRHPSPPPPQHQQQGGVGGVY